MQVIASKLPSGNGSCSAASMTRNSARSARPRSAANALAVATACSCMSTPITEAPVVAATRSAGPSSAGNIEQGLTSGQF